MLRKIKLYGELAKFLGQKTFEAEVHNAAQAIQYTCNVMDIRFEVITRENWNIIEELEDKIIFNATPVDVMTDNFLIDGRPYTDTGREIALYQAKEQFKIYTGVEID